MDISMEARTARAAALAKLMAGGTLVMRSGAKPSDCGAGSSGGEVVTFQIPDKVTVQNGSINVFGGPARAIVSKAGMPGFWRVEKDGKCVLQGDVSTDFPQMNDNLPAGYMVELRSWSLSDTVADV